MQNKRQKQSPASKSSLRPQNSRFVLEPRIVFDAALPIAGQDMFDQTQPQPDYVAEQPTEVLVASEPAPNQTQENIVATNDAENRLLIDGTLAPTNLTATEIIFIDAIVADLQQYITDHPNADVVLLDSTKDGLEQIAAVLAGRTGIESVHILSHGASGQLNLGNSTIDLTVLKSQYSDELATIKSALSESADILIYGCDVAAGEAGAAFVGYLASATGADIAASIDATGAASLGGNWNLETKTGFIEEQSIVAADWQGSLAPLLIAIANNQTPTVAGSVASTTFPGFREVTGNGIVGTTALWTNAGTVGGAAIDLRATVTAFTGPSTTKSLSFGGVGNDPSITLNSGAVSTAVSYTIKWEVLLAGTSTIASGSPSFGIADIDGTDTGGARESVAVSRTDLVRYSLNNPSTLTPTLVGANVNMVGTFNDVPGTSAGAKVEFAWDNVNSWTLTYSLAANTLTQFARYNMDGNGDLSFTNEVVTSFAPVAANDAFTTAPNTAVTINVRANDTDPQGDTFTVTNVNGTAITVGGAGVAVTGGVVTLNAAGNLVFTPNTGYMGTPSFNYTINDQYGIPATAIVSGTVDVDTDGDGVGNFFDIDDDNDGITDKTEGRDVVWLNHSTFASAPAGTNANTQAWGGQSGGSVTITTNSARPMGALLTNGGITAFRDPATGLVALEPTTPNTQGIRFAANPTPSLNTYTLTFSAPVKASEIVFFLTDLDRAFGLVQSVSVSGGTATADDFILTRLGTSAVPTGTPASFTQTGPNSGTADEAFGILGLSAATLTQITFNINMSDDLVAIAVGAIREPDTDGDGLVNLVDLDSDNDGISDLYESTGGTGDALADTNNNGTISLAESVAAGATGDGDIDNDGLMDIFDANTANVTGATSLGNTPINSDGDTRADYLDLDSDNDGIADTVEARLTAGYVANDGDVSNNDADKDGVINVFDTNDGTTKLFGGTFTAPVNTDGADLVDYLDTDSDNDSKLDSVESGLSTDTTDANGDGIRDSVAASYQDPDGLVNNPQVNLANEVLTTAEVAYREVNQAPVITVPTTQTTLEDTPIVFSTANGNAIQIADADAGVVTVTIWAENGLLTLSQTTGLTFSTNATNSVASTGANEATIRVTGSVANINAALNGLAFQPTANTNSSADIGSGTGVGKITIRTDDGGTPNLSDTDSVIINITALKDTTVDNVSTDEDTPITISPFTNDSFGAGNVFLTGVTAPTNGTSVLNVGLGTTTYTPTAGFSGTDSYTYTATTIDAGFTYEYYAVNQPDGSTYAQEFPTGFPTAAATGTGWTAGISATDGIRIQEHFSDTDDSNVVRWSGVVLIENAGDYTFGLTVDNAARLLIDGVPIVDAGWSQGTRTATITGLSTGVHTFQLEYGDTFGNQNVNLSYSGLDTGGSTVNVNNDKHWGAAARTETETINITINNVNDEPSGADNFNIAGTEDTPVTITTADFGFSDTLDATPNAFANVIITSLPPATEGVYQLNGSNIAINQIISVAQIDAGLLKFVPASGISGNDLGALGFKVQDNGGVANGGVDTDQTANTLAVDIAAVNDAPAGADNTVTTAEDGAYTFTVADFGFTDPNDTVANALQSVVITTLPPSGVLFLNGVAVTAGQVIPAGSIGLLTWTPPLNGNGNALSSFTFQLVDDGATGGANQNTDQSPNTIRFNVTPVNDAPVDGNETNTVTEDIVLIVADGGTGDLLNNATDVDGNSLSITGYTIDGVAGTQAVNAPVVIAGVGTVTINANGSYSFAPVANYNGAVPVITYTVSDGTLTDTSTLSLSVTPVNDVPIIDLNSTVDLNGNAFEQVTFTGNSGSLNGTTASGNTVTLISNSGTFVTPNTAVFDSAEYTISDPTVGGVLPAVRVLTSGAELLAGFPITITLAQPITEMLFHYNSLDGAQITAILANNPNLQFEVISSVRSITQTNGSTFAVYNVDVVSADGTTDEEESDDANGVTLGIGKSADGTIRIFSTTPFSTVNLRIDNAPTANTGDGLYFAVEVLQAPISLDSSVLFTEGDAPVAVTNVSLADVSDRAESDITKLEIVAGSNPDGVAERIVIAGQTFNLATTATQTATIGGTTVSIAYDAATKAFTITNFAGNTVPMAQADLDLLVRSVTYENVDQDPTVGNRTLTFTVTDSQSLTSLPAVATISITPVNDPPAGADNTVSTPEDTPYTVKAADFGFSDAENDAFANIIITNLPSAPEGVYQLNGSNIAINQVISVVQINAGQLKFVPTLNFNGLAVAALGFQVQDDGGTVLGGADTDPTPNTFTLNITPVDDVIAITGLNNGPAGTGSDAQVKESDLSAGSTPAGVGESTTGSFNLGAPSALTSLTINGGATITKAELINSATTPIVITTANGTLIINSYNSVTGEVSYSYVLTSPIDNSAPADNLNKNDNFNIVTTDVEGQTANGTLAINVLDDLPVANADTDEVVNQGGTADGNVLTGTGGLDSNNADGIADVFGADGPVSVTAPVVGVAAGAGTPIAGNLGGTGVAGTYGNLVLNADGSYRYTPGTSSTVLNLAPGATLTDTFTYSVGDADGDIVTTTLTITVVGVPSVTGLGNGTVAGTDGSVLESDLASGTNAAGAGEILSGDFILNAPLGVQTLSIKPTGQPAVLLSLADLTALAVTPRTFTTANGTLTLTGFNVVTGQVDYTYTLTTPANSSGSPTDDFEVILRDNSPNGGVATAPRFLKIAILDDAPIANADVANINENNSNITGNVVTASDLIGADGSSGSNNPVTGVIAGTGTPTGGVGSAVAGSFGSITLAANGGYTYTLNNANATVNALNVGQSLTETFTYKITDKDGDVSTTTLTITINGANDAPVVNPDITTTLEDTPVSGNVLTNDSDVDNTLTVSTFDITIGGVPTTFNAGDTATIPGVGTLTIGATGGYTFTPDANFKGTVPVVTYTATDGTTPVTSTLSLTVTSVNDAPAGTDTTISTREDTPVSLNAASFGFSDPNDSPANALQSVIITTLPTAGTLTLNGVNVTVGQIITAANLANLTFTPPLNGFGMAISSMTFQVVDNGGTVNGGQNTDQSPNTITFDVTSVNDAPAGADKTVTINEDQAYLVTAADFGFTDANDSPANSLANIIITALPLNTQGVYLLNGNPVSLGDVISAADINSGLFTFNPAANLNGSNLGALGFRVQDDGGTANGGVNADPTANTLRFNITSINDLPVATDDNVTTNEDTPVTLNLLGNDTDADGDTLSIKSINGVAITPGTAQTIAVPNGQVTVSATGVVTFEPNPNYFGPVTFDYVVQDGKGGEDTGTVNVSVISVNDKPTPAVDVTSAPEDTPVTGNVLSNDTDADGETLNVTQFTIPGVGTFAAGQTATIPGKGTLTIDNLGNYTFNPVLNFNGALPVVTYTVTDNSGAANQTATSTLSLTVTPVNDAPVATAITPSGNEDTPIPVNLAGTDLDGTVVSVTVTVLPPVTEGILYLADGTTPVDVGSPLTPAQAASLIFKPAPNFNGTVTPITFTVKDNQGLDSAPASANITIAPVIDLPVAINGSTNTPEDTNAAVNLAATDVDGTIASIRVTELPTPAEGVLYYADGITPVLTTDVISPADAATLIFVPTTNFNGLVNVKFTALDNDSNLSANVGNFLIDVADVNDAPIATPTTVNGTEDVTANVRLTGTDIDGTVTKITVDTLPPVTQGILYLADGVTPVVAGQPLTPAQAAGLKFDPTPNFNGTVIIPFTVTDDDNELSTPANLIINIGAVNDAPDANPDLQTVAEDTPATGNVIANDTDAEGSPLNVSQFNVPGVGTVAAGTTATIPGVGTILITANGDYTFTPVLNFNGNVPQITYTVSDGVNATNTTLNITVTSVNDPPAALATSPTGSEDTPIAVKLLGSDVDGTIASVTVTNLPPATDGILTFANGTPVPVDTAITPAQAAGLIFVPAPNFNGTVTIPFTVTDNQGATSSPADAVITVVPVNDPPVATPTTVAGNEDTPIALNLTGTDVEAPIASVTVVTLPPATQGILTKADGSPVVAGVPLTPADAAGLIFTPAPNFNGTLNIPFRVTDANGVTSPSANATINVISVNDPPVAIAGSVNTAEDTNTPINLKGTDVDGTVTNITVISLPDPSQGVLTFANGTPVVANVPMTPAQAAGLIFNPTANYNGVVTVLFTATDNVGAVSTPASFVIDVAAVDDDPVATSISPSGQEDTPLPVSLTGTDVEGPITAVTVVSLPPASQGILTKADGTSVVAGQPLTPTEAANLIFVPAPNFNGSVNIPFTVTDSVGQVSSPPTIAALTIVPVNDLPVAIPSTPSGNEDTPIPVRLTGTDVDGTVIAVTIVTPPTNGTLTLNGVPVTAGQVITPAQAASLVFNPAPNFVGSVDIVFTVTDNSGGISSPATTIITVNDVVSPPAGNPIAVGGSSEDVISVPLGGSDADGTIVSVTVQVLPPASQGVLTLADGTPVVAGVPLTPAQAAGLIFTPAPGANGTVILVFTVTDDEGLVSSPANASITIQDVSVLFEQLLAPPAKLNFDDPNRPDPFALNTPVIPMGMPEDLFVTHSVRESAMRIAQGSNFGVFNVDAPTRGELDNLTFDLKGLPVGMDPTLFVQHAVRHLPVTQEPRLFVQNAVRQSQLESTLRNIGTNSFNSATNGVLSLMSPFDLGSTNDAADLSVDAVQGEFIAPEAQAVQTIDEKQAQNSVPAKDLTVLERQKVEVNETLPQKPAAAGFAQQLSLASRRLKTTDLFKNLSN